MIEIIMEFVDEMSKPIGGEAYFGFALIALGIDFPLIVLSLIFYQIPEIKRINKKQFLLNNINLLFIITFCIFVFFDIFGGYEQIIMIFLAFIPPLIFLYLKIFKKQNYVFYNLINLWWILFWCISVSKVQYFYGAILVYLIIFFYKRLFVLIVSLLLILGLCLLRFYNLYFFDWSFIYFSMLFPSVLFFFSLIGFMFWSLKKTKEKPLNKDNIDLKKLIISTIALGFITALSILGSYQTTLIYFFVGWIFFIPFIVLFLFAIAKMAIYLVRKAK